MQVNFSFSTDLPGKPASDACSIMNIKLAWINFNQGNKAVKLGVLFEALKCYTAAITQIQKSKATIANNPLILDFTASRSSTFEKLGMFQKAGEDADSVLSNSNSCPPGFSDQIISKFKSIREKAILCKLKSLWGLLQYEEALTFIELVLPDYADKVVFQAMHKQAKTIIEQSKGIFDILELQKLHKERRHYVGEYKGPIESVDIPSKGKGLVATADIAMGEVIMCNKAFCAVFDEDIKPFRQFTFILPEAHNFLLESDAVLAAKMHQMLAHDNNLIQFTHQLYRGPPTKKATTSLQDVYYMIRYNTLKNLKDPETKSANYSGVWMMASKMNHSCIESNAYHSVFGDILLVRAVKPIKKGEEITITYWDPLRFLRRRAYMQKLGFQCECRLCEVETKENKKIKAKIEKLAKFVNRGMWKQDEQFFMDTSFKKFCQMRKILELRAQSGFPNATLYILGPHIDKLIRGLDGLQKYRHRIYLQENIHDFCKNTCFVIKSIGLAKDIMLGYFFYLKDLASVVKWWKQMKDNTIAAYGSVDVLDPLDILTEEEVEYFNSLEIDIEVMDAEELAHHYNIDRSDEEEDCDEDESFMNLENDDGESSEASEGDGIAGELCEAAREFYFDGEGYADEKDSNSYLRSFQMAQGAAGGCHHHH